MTTPVRFWRLYFRSINTYNYGQLIFRTLKPHDASGNPLTSGVSLSISAGLMNGTSFPLANLIDIDTALESCDVLIVLVDHDAFKAVPLAERAAKGPAPKRKRR